MFLYSLVRHAGSTAAAGGSLEVLLENLPEGAGPQPTAFQAWAKALAKPERAAAGRIKPDSGASRVSGCLDLMDHTPSKGFHSFCQISLVLSLRG